ncbi:hypothetical protein DB345_08195 [Spartobacteria bacterium LR76]|nr:hypothetical protein DB345_08195 [Spartobacteria bacterium LR76]
MRSLLHKVANLCEILLLPGGLAQKIKHRDFHWKDYRMCLRLRGSGVKPSTIFDIGANRGQFAIGATGLFPEADVHCFEPGSVAFSKLKAEFQDNPRVKVHKIALGRSPGVTTLRVTSQDQSSSILPLHENHRVAYPEIVESRSEEVEVSTLTKEWEKLQPASPVLLKIDTQGFEMAVLEGAEDVLQKIQWVILETCTRPMYEGEALFGEINEWLSRRGFFFRGPVEIHFSGENQLCQFDALFERR